MKGRWPYYIIDFMCWVVLHLYSTGKSGTVRIQVNEVNEVNKWTTTWIDMSFLLNYHYRYLMHDRVPKQSKVQISTYRVSLKIWHNKI